jgi:hypothetical protein
MIFPQSISQGNTGRCDQNGLDGAEMWTSVRPCLELVVGVGVVLVVKVVRRYVLLQSAVQQSRCPGPHTTSLFQLNYDKVRETTETLSET